jgi:hypothetical protein
LELDLGLDEQPGEKTTGPFEMGASDLMLLLSGIDVSATRRRRWYERVA